MAREKIAGPDGGPEAPFPIELQGKVIKGFGRGSKELGIPTANIPVAGLDIGGHTNLENGIYFGWAGLSFDQFTAEQASEEGLPDPHKNQHTLLRRIGHAIGNTVDTLVGTSKDPYAGTEAHVDSHGHTYAVYPMVASIGMNPYYKNEKRSVEIHIIHQFHSDFYGAPMNVSILGFIRPEKDYSSKEALIEDIQEDIQVSSRSLQRHEYAKLASSKALGDFGWALHPTPPA